MQDTKKICHGLKAYFSQRPPRLIDEFDYVRAAVLLPLVETKDGLSILFEVRSSELSWQPGEICFPGGRIEEDDPNPEATAVRESCEELSIRPEEIAICGPLDFITTQMGVIVYPYVGIINDIGNIKASSSEVAEVFTVPVGWLLEKDPLEAEIYVTTEAAEGFPYELLPGYSRTPKRRKSYKVYFYNYEGHVIWGLTARILHGFLQNFRDIVSLD